MNRLQSELHRLYLLPAPQGEACLMDARGRVRALVMALAGPADWSLLSRVWRGVQTDLALPAPAIAVSGTEALQLWFSLQQPVPAARAAAFLAQLRSRYLPDLQPAARLVLSPAPGASSFGAALVPAEQGASGNWSAFVAPDLAPVFAETPWLDIPPGIEGQADLLARLECIRPADFDALLAAAEPPDAPQAVGATARPDVEPALFLQQVLNDESAALALRVEAATALLALRHRR